MTWKRLFDRPVRRLYAGDVPSLPQYDGFIGLSICRDDDRHIHHDITLPIPIAAETIDAFQSEDVFEHIHYERLLPVIDEIFRVLRLGGLFRLSLPDYGTDFLRDRTVRDAQGNLVFDPGGGGTLQNPGHVWFPMITSVRQLLEKSLFASHGSITYFHYYDVDGRPITHPIDYSRGHVQRTPDFDKRAMNPYRPMSLVVDLTKTSKN